MTVERCRIAEFDLVRRAMSAGRHVLEPDLARRDMSAGRHVLEPDLARRAMSTGSRPDPARGAAA
jgi:hypothetical protein